jgi:hypothetical protein
MIPVVLTLPVSYSPLMKSKYLSSECLHTLAPYDSICQKGIHQTIIQDKERKKDATLVLSEMKSMSAKVLKQHTLLRKLHTSNRAFSKPCFIKYKITLGLYPKYTVHGVISKSRLSRINIINDYKKN